jgi:hypothetical protein
MKLPTSYSRPRPSGGARSVEQKSRTAASAVTMQAQQGVYECQEDCRQRYPNNVQEQLRCYRRECWS